MVFLRGEFFWTIFSWVKFLSVLKNIVCKNENCDPNIPYILKVASNPKFVFLKLLYKKVLLKQKILFFDASRIRGGEDK